MKKFLTIPFFIIAVSLGTFWGYSFLDDPADYNPNGDKNVKQSQYDFTRGTTATWTTLTASPHAQSRSFAAMVTIAGVDYIYQFGGGANALLTNVARYNINTATWTDNYSTMPQQISAGSAVVMDDSLLYVFGGNNPSLGFTLKYNYITNTWTQMASMPTPVTDAGCVKHGDKVYLVGGGTGLFGVGYFNTVQVYNTTTNTYSTATNYPLAVGMMGIGIQGDTIITAGGWDGVGAVSNSYKGIINSGDPSIINWTPIANYPGGAVTRMGSAPVTLGTGGGVMFAGGAVGGATLTATSYLYNMCTGSWETLPNISQARSNFKGASKNGDVAYIVGGFTTVGVGTFERVNFTDITGDCFTGGGSGSITVCRDGLNKPIPDNGGNANHLRDTIVVSGVPVGNEITQMMVTIDSLPHTWVGDIRIWIEKVGGPVDTVISRVGLGSGAFPGAGNSCNDFINTNLVDSASALIQSIQDPAPGCGNGAGQIPANGYFKPKDPLTGFLNDIDPNGTYIIHISDNAAADVGSLVSWCLTIDYDILTNAGTNTSIVSDYQLHQNYPNPFNPTTKIRFEIPKQNFVSLKIYDISGREVANLINGERTAGAYDIEFDGSYLASGTYFYRLQAGDFVQVKKMVLLK